MRMGAWSMARVLRQRIEYYIYIYILKSLVCRALVVPRVIKIELGLCLMYTFSFRVQYIDDNN